MKSVLIDIYKIKDPFSGLGQFSLNFAEELSARELDKFQFNFLIPPKGDIPNLGENATLVKTTTIKRYFPALNKDYDIWHSLHQFPSFLPKKSSTWILTIHDLNFLIEKNDRKKNRYLNQLQKNVDRADYITAISQFTKSEVEKNLNLRGKEIKVIYNGVGTKGKVEKVEPPFIGKKKFFFSIGIFNAKKNFKVLLPLLKHVAEHDLVIAGNNETAYGKEMISEVSRLGLSERVHFPGKISNTHKQWLYANCEAFLFPSLAEGFGLPVIEAMQEGAPVFLSKLTSLPEIGGSMAFYFEDFDEEKMAEIIKSNLAEVNLHRNDFSLRSKKYAEKFSWESSISSYLNLYREALESRGVE